MIMKVTNTKTESETKGMEEDVMETHGGRHIRCNGKIY